MDNVFKHEIITIFLLGTLDDLWKFDGYNWAWISGSNYTNQHGIYGTQLIPSSSNIPGSRDGSTGWIDSNDNFWLFGGFGSASIKNPGKIRFHLPTIFCIINSFYIRPS